MKNIIVAFLFCLSASAQTLLDTDILNNSNNVFLYSLKEYCKSLDSTSTKVVYVKWDTTMTELWPSEINGFEIRYLQTGKEYRKAIKGNGDSMTVIGIGSLEYRKGKFYVGIIPFGTTYKKRTIHFRNSGDIKFFFEYNEIGKGLFYVGKK